MDIEQIIRDVAELPDRTSPDDQPEMMLVSADELRSILSEVCTQVSDALVNRFLAWPLPKSVCSDLCATDANYKFPRSGTNLLTADEARQMVEYLLAPSAAENTERRLRKLDQLGFDDAAKFARNPHEN